jgi:hypothetical protein
MCFFSLVFLHFKRIKVNGKNWEEKTTINTQKNRVKDVWGERNECQIMKALKTSMR